jgi:hypothetical protein
VRGTGLRRLALPAMQSLVTALVETIFLGWVDALPHQESDFGPSRNTLSAGHCCVSIRRTLHRIPLAKKTVSSYSAFQGSDSQ